MISQYLYDQYTEEYSGVKEWDKPEYERWLEEKLFKAQVQVLKSDSLPCVRLSLPDAKMLAKIIKWYRMKIVNHGLPDRKKYREFCKQKELELLSNEA